MKGKSRQQGLQKRAAAQAANSRRRKRRRTGKKTIHYILLVLFVLAAGVVLSFTTFFKIEDVVVLGTDKYPPDEIARRSGIELGENLLQVSFSQVEEAILGEYPYIESVEIRRKLPPAVEIWVNQAVPAAAILEGEEIILITREGKVLERGKLFVPPAVPIVQGIPVGRTQPGEWLGEEAAESLVMLGYLFRAMDSTGFRNITNVDLTDKLNMRIIYENRLLLKLGTEADLDHKLHFVQNVLDRLPDDQQGRIDVSNAKTKNRLVLKKITLQEAIELEYANRLSQEDLLSELETEEYLHDETAVEDKTG